jgi:peroxiredoxin
MTDSNRMTLREQIDSYQQEMAARLAPEAVERFNARRAALVETGLAEQALKAGQAAPDFTLPDASGQPITLSGLLARGPVVLTFYRGDWCPYCNLTLRAYQAALPEITALGASLVAVSPQDADHTQLTVEHKALTFPVLSDRGNAVARRFGLVWSIPEEQRATSAKLPDYNGDETWELPVPGTFVIAPDRAIRLAFADADWTHRLEPAAIVESLAELARERELSHD